MEQNRYNKNHLQNPAQNHAGLVNLKYHLLCALGDLESLLWERDHKLAALDIERGRLGRRPRHPMLLGVHHWSVEKGRLQRRGKVGHDRGWGRREEGLHWPAKRI